MAPSPPPTTEPPTTKADSGTTPSSSKAEKDVKVDSKSADNGLSTQELDKLLAREASAFQRDVEVDRILKAFKLNPYDILGLETSATPADIKKRYRHLSLFIHPDKATHPRATDAFDLLKKAEGELSDQAKRDELDAVILEARAQTLKSHSLPTGISDTDPRVLSLVPAFKEQVRTRTKDILIDEEVRRRKAIKMNLANEGLEARRKDEETAAKKRKAEEDARWEGAHLMTLIIWPPEFIGELAETRDERVGSWRTFNAGKKKKKTKPNVLG